MRLILILILALSLPAFAADKKIVMVAGKPSHGPGDHEFNAGVTLLAGCLKDFPGVQIVKYHNGWPAESNAFDGAAAIILYMDGGGGHPVNKQLDQLAPLMDKGVGLMCMHYAVEVPVGPSGDAFKKWIGGFYESGWSINPHWDAQSILAKDHPITRGVNPFTLRDEWYYNMRWRDDSASVTPILQAIPDKEARSGSTSSPRGPKKHIVDAEGRIETLMWAVQRPDGGRGVGFTGGHFHKNWADEGQRKLVLNAILWVANVQVPAGGVSSKVTDAQMAANLDVKQPRKAPAPKKK